MTRILAWFKEHPRAALLLALPVLFGLGIAVGRYTRPEPAIHAETTSKATTTDAAVRNETKTEAGADREWTFYGYTGAETPLGPAPLPMSPAPGQRVPGAQAAPGSNPCGVVAVMREHVGPVTTTVQEETQHAEAQELRQTLDVTPAARPGWAVQVGADDVLGARAIRLELRRRLIGPLWVGASAVPGHMQLGLSASFEF